MKKFSIESWAMDRQNSVTNHPLDRGLLCAALNASLRSILVFDGTSEMLELASKRLRLMLEAVTGQKVQISRLGVTKTEEDLWGNMGLRHSTAGSESFEWQAGDLAVGRGTELRLVFIPDLNRLSLAGIRACVTLMGADVAYLERYGQTDAWRPNLCWLAGCASDRQQIGRLSPHLLDRFLLRLNGRNSARFDGTVHERLALLEEALAETVSVEPVLSPEILAALARGQSMSPTVLPNAKEQALKYVSMDGRYSVRRDLALLRLAQASAIISGREFVLPMHVDEAARLIGWRRLVIDMPSNVLSESEPEPEIERLDSPETVTTSSDHSLPIVHQPEPEEKAEVRQEPIEIAMGAAPIDPHPEDGSPILREASALKLPLRRFKNAHRGRGEIIGVEPTTLLEDLAIIDTFKEAWVHQPYRKRILATKGITQDGLVLLPTDLRRYRRTVVPVQMLAVVMDFTCLEQCAWQERLLPYLQWAYIERAGVCLVQVGAVNEAEGLLRATKILAPNVLVPRFTRGLEATKTAATPLAHGLSLVLQTLRHALQHGRSSVEQAVLVVLSDGRGNIPLAASQMGQLVAPVGQLGIEDALEEARKISALQRVTGVVLHPELQHYQDLPVELAIALGAKISVMAQRKANDE
jgi:magnesium chelatase subunit D